MKKILFIDRDGTIIEEPPGDCQVDSMSKLAFVPGVIGALRELARDTDYRLVMVSNQDGLGTERFPVESFLQPHEFMLRTLAGEGVVFDEVLIDESMPEDESPRRKPGTGMVEKYLGKDLDREHSYVIGGRICSWLKIWEYGEFISAKRLPRGKPWRFLPCHGER